MLMVISPAKTLDYSSSPATRRSTKPELLAHSEELVRRLRDYSVRELAGLMKLSEKLSQLNFDRYAKWEPACTTENSKPAVLAMKGDVYTGMDADSFNNDDFSFAQKHLRILSGLYGVLRPLDLMQPYRLEMGTALETDSGRNLYQFWGDVITNQVNRALHKQGDGVLLNLASNEYFKSIKLKQVQGRIITPQFKEKKGDDYRVIGVFAKKARGLMARHIIKNRISEPDRIKDFCDDGYGFNPSLSDSANWVFTRS
jgi:uncharacterized protein